MEYIQHHVTKPPIALDQRVPGKTFPPGLGAVLAQALEKRPEDRYATAAEFADALKSYAPGGGKGFSGLFPASNLAALEQVTRAHAEASKVSDKGPDSQRNGPVSSRGVHAAQQDLAPRSQRSPGLSSGTNQPIPPTQRPLPSPQSIRQPMKSGTNEGPTSGRAMASQPMPKPQDAALAQNHAQKPAPSMLTLIAVAVGFLLVGVLLAVVVLKLLR
jgi:hypothetical protein